MSYNITSQPAILIHISQIAKLFLFVFFCNFWQKISLSTVFISLLSIFMEIILYFSYSNYSSNIFKCLFYFKFERSGYL